MKGQMKHECADRSPSPQRYLQKKLHMSRVLLWGMYFGRKTMNYMVKNSIVRFESQYRVSYIYVGLNLPIEGLNLSTIFGRKYGTVFLDIFPKRASVFGVVLKLRITFLKRMSVPHAKFLSVCHLLFLTLPTKRNHTVVFSKCPQGHPVGNDLMR